MKIKIARMVLIPSSGLKKRDAVKLRGYIAGKLSDEISLHNHTPDDKFVYRYPHVQYKVINNIPHLILLQDSIRLISELERITDTITIEDKNFDVYEKNITISEEEICQEDKLTKYKFLTPWLALNQDNHLKYLKLDEEGKREFLTKIFIGNLLSMSKSFGYNVEGKIMAYCNVKQVEYPVKFKNREMVGFMGEVTTNFRIPDLMGIGKAASRGMGVLINTSREGGCA